MSPQRKEPNMSSVQAIGIYVSDETLLQILPSPKAVKLTQRQILRNSRKRVSKNLIGVEFVIPYSF
jgi:hypothetical protein